MKHKFYTVYLREGRVTCAAVVHGYPRLTHSYRPSTSRTFERSSLSLFDVLKNVAKFFGYDELGFDVTPAVQGEIAIRMLSQGPAYGWYWDEFEWRELLEDVRVSLHVPNLRQVTQP